MSNMKVSLPHRDYKECNCCTGSENTSMYNHDIHRQLICPKPLPQFNRKSSKYKKKKVDKYSP